MTNSKLKRTLLVFMVILAIVAFLERKHLRMLLSKIPGVGRGVTVEDQVAKYGPTAHRRVAAVFRSKGLEYPPDKLALLAFKDSRQIQIYVANGGKPYRFVRSYTIFGASGVSGPKLIKGDKQVPEGIYRISSLEPSCPYHLGLRINYPNEFDQARAKEDGRTNLGGDILIHGNSGSISCLAVGDQASEDLFVLVYDTKDRDIPVIISPSDFRQTQIPAAVPDSSPWISRLYNDINKSLALFPVSMQK